MKECQPKVSIIVPVYNAEEYVGDCIESILAQTESNFELILIDDGSIDKTEDICKYYAMQDKRIQYFRYMNSGVSVSRNRGIEKAKGMYTIFADADDILCENCLEVLLIDIMKYDCDVVVAGFFEWRSEQCIIPHYGTNKMRFIEGDNVLKVFLEESVIHSAVWAKIYKTELVKKAMFPINISIAEDMYYVYLILKMSSKILLHDVCIYKYKITENSAMSSSISDKNFDAFKIYKMIYEDIVDIYPNLENKADKFFLKNYLWQLRYIYSINLKSESMLKMKAYKDKLKKIRKSIQVYKIKTALTILEKKQWIEFFIIKIAPFIYTPYIKGFLLYQKICRDREKI